jgi:hypothetical protein
MEVKVKLEKCRKKAKKDLPMFVHAVYKEQLSDILVKGYDMVTEIPKFDHVKARQYKERRRVLSTEPNLEDSSKIVCWEEVLRLANNSRFYFF